MKEYVTPVTIMRGGVAVAALSSPIECSLARGRGPQWLKFVTLAGFLH